MLMADAVTTVSPTYARELHYPYFAHGLQGVVDMADHKLYGIQMCIRDSGMARAGLCRRAQLQQSPHLSLRPVYAFDRFSGTAAPRAGPVSYTHLAEAARRRRRRSALPPSTPAWG